MSTTDAVSLVVPGRFAGPPGSANGGWLAGRLVELSGLRGPAEVTLRHPPPLEVDLDVRTDDHGLTTLGFGGAVIAEARAADLAGELVGPVDLATAQAAMAGYAGESGHPFPGCFVCGPDRPAPDGLGLRPGRLPGRPDTVATAWFPDASVASRTARCPRGWCGQRWTAPAAGPATWWAGRWCSAG